jgi:transcriptional regulator with XRE-family HTH domain
VTINGQESVFVTLQQWRNDLGLSQRKLARLMGVSQHAVSQLELRPVSGMSLITIERRAEAVDCDVLVCALVEGRLVQLVTHPVEGR